MSILNETKIKNIFFTPSHHIFRDEIAMANTFLKMGNNRWINMLLASISHLSKVLYDISKHKQKVEYKSIPLIEKLENIDTPSIRQCLTPHLLKFGERYKKSIKTIKNDFHKGINLLYEAILDIECICKKISNCINAGENINEEISLNISH